MPLRSCALTLLSLLAILYTLYFARFVLIPVTLAVMLFLLLAPAVRRLAQWRIPAGISSALLLIAILSAVLTTGAVLAEPVKEWLQEAPTNLRQLTREIEEVKAPLKEIKELEEEVTEMTEVDSAAAKPPQVEIKNPPMFDKLIKALPMLLGSLLFTFMTAYFLLATGDGLAQRILTFGRTWRAKRAIIKVSRGVQSELSGYLRTVTLINLMLGVSVGLCLWWLGVPNPELWGAMVAILNFAPYLGAVTSALVLALVGVSTFPSLSEALAVPGIFILLTTLEGALFTPLVLGRRMSLNPLVVFLSVIVWGWLWGVPGALLAVPLMCSLKVVLTHIDSTQRFARLLEH